MIGHEQGMFMVDSASFALVGDRRLDGKATYGAPQPFKCRDEPGDVKIVNPAGDEVVARGRLLMDGVYKVPVTAQLTLPDGSHATIVRVDTASGLNLDTERVEKTQTTIYYGS